MHTLVSAMLVFFCCILVSLRCKELTNIELRRSCYPQQKDGRMYCCFVCFIVRVLHSQSQYSLTIPERPFSSTSSDNAAAGSRTSDLSITNPTLNQCNYQDNYISLMISRPKCQASCQEMTGCCSVCLNNDSSLR